MLAADSEDAPRQKMLPSTRLIRLTTAQRSAISEGKWLDDNTIHAAQLLLSRQAMGNVSGLTNPLLLHKSLKTSSKPFVQIFNQHENHWVVASNIGCNSGCVRLYDSSSKETDEATNKILSKLLQTSNSFMTVEVMNVQQQRGGNDCRVFAIAFATSLVLGQCPTLRSYTQKNMRRHLLECLESKEIALFPSRTVNKKYHQAVLHTYNLLVICKCRQIESGHEVQCDECQEWFHLECVDLDGDSDFFCDSVPWFCNSCKYI